MAIKINGTNTTASPGITGPDTDTGLVYGTDEVQVVTGGTTRATVDSSGRLLLGTTTEGEATADNLTIADSGHCGITLRSGTSSVGTIFFSDATSGTAEYQGYVQYDHSGNYLKWATAATERMRIDSSGNLTAYSGSTNGNYFVIRGKHSPGNDFNRSEVRFGVENNANGLGFLAFATGNNTASERMRIDSSGSVGIGTTSPSQRLSLNIGGDQTWFQIDKSRAANEPMLQLVHSAGNRSAKIRYANSDGSWSTGIDSTESFVITSGENTTGGSGTERMRIDSSGNVILGFAGNNLFFKNAFNNSESRIQCNAGSNSSNFRFLVKDSGSESETVRFQSSGGISFNGDTAAANALDDYEEGTWTPTVTNGASGVTVDASNCIYVKVGSLVTCHFEIYDATSPNNNPLDFGGLPYAPDTEGTFPVMSNSVDFPAGRTMLTG